MATAVPKLPERRKSLADLLPDSPPKSARSKFSWAGLKQRVMSAAIGGSAADVDAWNIEDLPANFFDLSAQDAKGADLPLAEFRGSATLCLNVASF